MKKYFKYSSALTVLFFSLAAQAMAATTGTGNDGGGGSTGTGNDGSNLPSTGGSIRLENPLKSDSLIGFFKSVLDVIMVLAVPLIVFFIIYAGFLYVTARGNPETISRAHKALLYAIIGGLLILGASIILEVIQGTVSAF